MAVCWGKGSVVHTTGNSLQVIKFVYNMMSKYSWHSSSDNPDVLYFTLSD